MGEGGFGVIYQGQHTKTLDKVAIKLEKIDCEYEQLNYEANIYKRMKGRIGIPNIHWFGVQDKYNVMVMDLLGPTLRDLFEFCERTFTPHTIAMLAH